MHSLLSLLDITYVLLQIYCLKGRVMKSENKSGDRGNFHFLVHSPDACKGRDLAKPKLGATNSIQISHVGGRASNS